MIFDIAKILLILVATFFVFKGYKNQEEINTMGTAMVFTYCVGLAFLAAHALVYFGFLTTIPSSPLDGLSITSVLYLFAKFSKYGKLEKSSQV